MPLKREAKKAYQREYMRKWRSNKRSNNGSNIKVRDYSGEKTKELPFMADEKRAWMLNPKARIGPMELMPWKPMRKSQEAGEPRDPFEVMTEQARNTEMLRNVFGGTSLTEMIGTLKDLRNFLAPDDDVKALLYSISQKLDQTLQESEDTKALRQEVQQLRDQLQEERREALSRELAAAQSRISQLESEQARLRENTVGRTEYDLMDRLLGTIDQRTGDVTGLIKGFVGNPLKALPSGEKEVAEESGLD